MDQRLSIITLGVGDLKVSRAFYERLGWQVATEQGSDALVAFNLQAFTLALYPREKLAEDAGLPMDAATPSMTLAYNVGSKAEVDQVMGEAASVGARVVKEASDAFWGGYSGYFADPDGYLWEVAFNPYAVLSEDGAFRWC